MATSSFLPPQRLHHPKTQPTAADSAAPTDEAEQRDDPPPPLSPANTHAGPGD